MLRPLVHHVVCCCMSLLVVGVVTQSLKPVKPLSQQLLTFLLFRDRRHMVSKLLWVVSSLRCTAGPTIVGSCCIRLQTTANTYATTQQCWDLLRPFARSLKKTIRPKLWQNHCSKTQKSVAARRSKTQRLCLTSLKMSCSSRQNIQDWLIPESYLPFAQIRYLYRQTATKAWNWYQGCDFTNGTRISVWNIPSGKTGLPFQMVPEIFRGQDPKVMFHVRFYVTMRKIASVEPRC